MKTTLEDIDLLNIAANNLAFKSTHNLKMALEMAIEHIKEDRIDRQNEENQTRPYPKDICCICHITVVDVTAGFDTCSDCQKRI